MKIACTIYIENRSLKSLSVKSRQKHIKSTLALCRNGKSEQKFLIIHFTAQNKTGTKYNVTDNVSTILTKFINEGKATIQFKEPPHDMYIQGNMIQLKGFLLLLKRALQNQISDKELTVSSLSVMPFKKKDMPVESLVVKKRSELPLRGFPRTLKSLSINEIEMCSVPIGVLQLQALRSLDLSNNKLERIPIELNKIALEDIDFSNNELWKSTPKQWNWIGGVLKQSLVKLNLSCNKLKTAKEVVRLDRLENLQLDKNQMRKLPRAIGRMRRLRTLSVRNNFLYIMPVTMGNLNLETLDISGNYFRETLLAPVRCFMPRPPLPLKEIAGRFILENGIPFGPGDIPYVLVQYLEEAYYCVCGRPCFSQYVKLRSVICLDRIARVVISDPECPSRVDIQLYCCTLACVARGCRF